MNACNPNSWAIGMLSQFSSHVGSCLTENYWQILLGRCKSVKSLSLEVIESNKEFQMV